MRVVLRLQAADIKRAPIRLQSELQQPFRIGVASDLCAVSDHLRLLLVALRIVILNDSRISHNGGRQEGRKPFGDQVILPTDPVPLLPLALQPIYVDQRRCSEQARDEREGAVRRVAYQNGVVTARRGMENGKKSMNNSVETFMTDGRKDHQIHAVVRRSAGGRVVFTAVDCYIVSSGRQPRSELFRECFKTAIFRRNSSSPQNCDFHTGEIW